MRKEGKRGKSESRRNKWMMGEVTCEEEEEKQKKRQSRRGVKRQEGKGWRRIKEGKRLKGKTKMKR